MIPASDSAPTACRACSRNSARPTAPPRASTAAPASAWRSASSWPNSWAAPCGPRAPGRGRAARSTSPSAAVRAELPQGTRRDFVGQQPQLAGKRILVVDDNATNRRILALQTAKWGMVVQDTEFPAQALRDAPRRRAYDLAILDMHMPGMDGATARRAHPRGRAQAAAGAVQLARRARRRPTASSPRRWPSRCARASCSTRWCSLLAHDEARKAAPLAAKPRMDAGMARAPPAAHPAGRRQRGEPEARHAAAAADGLPGRPGQQRHRGDRVRRAPALRRGADGRADARDGWARGQPAHRGAVAGIRPSARASSR